MGWLAGSIDWLNAQIGAGVRWLLLALLAVQFVVVLLRYVFGTSYISLQEGVIYLHATVLMLGAGYTLLADGHVRVDVFYAQASPRAKAWVDLLGSLLLLAPSCLVLLLFTWRSMVRSWAILEGPMSVGGIPAVFYLKTLLPLFAVLLLLQGLSLVLHALVTLTTPTPEADR
ncbi:MAG: TRAP transporter small permease subunit [Candidatus Competibacterales bacterium]